MYQIMEEDILNYSPTVMFRETPCSLNSFKMLLVNLFALFHIRYT